MLGHGSRTSGVKGGTSTAHTELHLKLSLRRLEGYVHASSHTPGSAGMENGQTPGGR